ncbi:unnamed protein product, partial [Brugia timori]|uniref:G_PROTEIN_RECEP_F1_2 domain-containing protein n=1 Tax=Brugia timori TaxID=42155 RepID=A0A0R3Q9W9_9BILA
MRNLQHAKILCHSFMKIAENCSLLFNYGSKYRWLHHTSYHGQICARIDAIVSVALIVAMACTDFITLLKIIAYHRTMRRNTTESTTVSVINEKEVLFFKQSCKLGLLYISCAVTYNIPSYLLTDKWMLFISSTIAVLLVHSLDGLIFLVFNRKLICKTNFDGTSIAPATNFQCAIMGKNSELEDDIAIACITMVAIFGLLSNGMSLYITLTGSRFRNAFGILCTSFLICNLQAIFSLSTWCIIVLTVKSHKLSLPEFFFTRPVGIFVNGPYYASLFVHFFVAVNRFCAFVYATKYNQLWSKSKAILVGVMSWVVGTTISMAH